MQSKLLTSFQRTSCVDDYDNNQRSAVSSCNKKNISNQSIMDSYQRRLLSNEPGSINFTEQFVEISALNDGQLQAAMYAMDMLCVGYMLITENGSVLSLNNMAKSILNSQTCLNIQEKHLKCKKASDNIKLHKSVIKVAHIVSSRKKSDEIHNPVYVVLPLDKQDAVLSIALFPAQSSNNRGSRITPNVVVVITLDDVAHILSDLFLSSMYGMTRAEARLTQLIARGRTLQEAAECLSLSIHTIRTRLRAILAKTGARRQAELVSQVWRARWLRIG